MKLRKDRQILIFFAAAFALAAVLVIFSFINHDVEVPDVFRSTHLLPGSDVSFQSPEAMRFLAELRHIIPDVILSTVLVFFGTVCVLLSLLLPPGVHSPNGKRLFYMGLFSIFSALWMFPGLRSLCLLSTNRIWIYLLYYSSFMLFPIPFILFFRSLYHYGKKSLLLFNIIFLLNFTLQFSLYLFGIIDLFDTSPVTHILMVAALIYFIILGFLEFIRYRTKILFIITGCIILLLTAAVDLLRYYHILNDGNDLCYYMKFGFLILVLILAIYVSRERITVMNAASELEVYQRLAYIDSSTKLANRAAYDKELSVLQHNLEKYKSVAFLVFDLNNLKTTNDTYGHLAGDEIIVSFAECLTSIFAEKGHCFRIGGDEFAVIQVNHSEEDIKQSLLQLKKTVDLHNVSHLYAVDYACGYARDTIQNLSPESLLRLLQQADNNMYAQKRKHHGIQIRMEQ